LRVEIVADQFAPSSVRHHLRPWLNELRWPPDAVDDLLLAVSEAVSNVVDHAYPPDYHGPVSVHAVHLEHANEPHRDDHQAAQGEEPDQVDRVVVTVADRGSWRPIPTMTGNRGRGLTMMRATTQTLDIATSPTGTRVTLTSNSTHTH
jgi:anti-sigma regulatory factor (Ser/Thr protein kinase)